jgi:hypothetical protein
MRQWLKKLSREPSLDDFAAHIAGEFGGELSDPEALYDPDDGTLILRDGENELARITLPNMYGSYRDAERAERMAIVAEIVQSALTTGLPESYEEAVEHIRPKVIAEARQTLDRLYMQSIGVEPFDVPCWPLTDELTLVLAYDTGPGIIDLERSALEKWGVDADEVLDEAFGRLQRMSEEPFDCVAPGLYVSPWKDCYDAARLCLPDLFHGLELRGDPVALAPNRNNLLVTGSDDPEGLARLASLSGPLLDEDRLVHGGAIRLHDGVWEPFEPTDLAAEFAGLRRKADATYYKEQAELLDKINASNGEKLFVAPFRVAEDKESGMTFSYTVWQTGVPALLPKCDLIALYGEAAEVDTVVLMAKWEPIAELAGHLMQPTELSPPRFRVDEFPNLGIMEQIKAHSIDLG